MLKKLKYTEAGVKYYIIVDGDLKKVDIFELNKDKYIEKELNKFELDKCFIDFDFNLIFENMVTYFTGSYPILSIVILFVFILTLLARGIDFRYSVLFILPLAKLQCRSLRFLDIVERLTLTRLRR